MTNIASLNGNICKTAKLYVFEVPTKYEGISEKSEIITPNQCLTQNSSILLYITQSITFFDILSRYFVLSSAIMSGFSIWISITATSRLNTARSLNITFFFKIASC